MPSPCGGCPPCCKSCVFTSVGENAAVRETIVSAVDYGCVKGFGAIVTDTIGRLGQVRGASFHPVSSEGAAFLRASGNPLTAHLG